MIPEEMTKEQSKKVTKILFKSFLSVVFIALKFSFTLLAANLFCLFLGIRLLIDAAPGVLTGFAMVSGFTNAIFLWLHFNKQFKSQQDSVEKQIKEVFKDKE